ncbi:LysR family transcriptional regulator [Vagococcus silagei]|nr:LysR family transcriptional regulator [Vagococcus silagei]
MNLRQLRLFLNVCETMSMTKTAQNLYLSQPAISKAIKELEQELDEILFDRINGRLFLTDEGRLFKIKASQVVQDFDSLRDFTTLDDDKLPLKIGVSLTIGRKTLGPALDLFKETYPETPLKIYAENINSIKQRLLNGEIDVAFTEGFESNQEFEREWLSTYEMLFVCGRASKWAGKMMSREDILEVPFLMREKGSSLRDAFDAYLYQNELEMSPVLESVNTEILVNAAEKGLGVTLLSKPLADIAFKNHELAEIKLEGFEGQSTNYCVMLKGKKQSRKLRKIIACFKEIEQKSSRN